MKCTLLRMVGVILDPPSNFQLQQPVNQFNSGQISTIIKKLFEGRKAIQKATIMSKNA